MLQKIKNWLRERKNKKDFKKIKEGLLSHPKLLLEKKAAFEKAFGVDSRTRTKEQWQRLVNVYGIRTVAATENMSEEQVRKIMVETYDQKLKRRLKKV